MVFYWLNECLQPSIRGREGIACFRARRIKPDRSFGWSAAKIHVSPSRLGEVMRHNAFVALLLFLLLGGAQCGDPDLTHVSLTQVLADLGSYDGRRVEMNVRLSILGEGYDDGSLACLEDPCCGSFIYHVVFGDADCPFRQFGGIIETETGGETWYYGDACAGEHPPASLLGPEIELELGAEYRVRGTIVVLWSNGVAIGPNFILESASRISPVCND